MSTSKRHPKPEPTLGSHTLTPVPSSEWATSWSGSGSQRSVDAHVDAGGHLERATGFLMFEFDIAAKWLELLKQIAPQVTRAAVLLAIPLLTAAESPALTDRRPSLGIAVSPINLRDDAGDVERAITAFARSPNGGLLLRRARCRGCIAA